ncbi:MAG: tryptophan synthase subunit alpha [Fimbriimonadaceae bacterium]|nr:tryptophan synthase subunit alpha [Fimbriimonadaceae bacterium]QYK59032.1 MAG: tryptophan synthase subunit alpha [Fimbriimonadaceae bacterium]
MRQLGEVFGRLREKREGALVLFVTAGDPPLAQLPAILETLATSGADVIEVGLPFSDPIADGPVIQASSQRALDRGTKTADVLAALRGFDLAPVVLMGYTNPMARRGLGRFALDAAGAGAAGTIVCDLTPDDAGDWREASREAGLDTVFLAAPTSTDERLDRVCEASTGFVYAVSRTGVTGAGHEAWDEARTLVGRIRARTDLPVCVGFGVSGPADVREVCSFADGAIIGSRLVTLLADRWRGGEGREEVAAWVREAKAAARR